MRSLLKLILRFHFFILFFVIEIISFTLIVTYNNSQRSSFMSSSNVFTGFLSSTMTSFSEYLSLKEVNKSLSEENARLRNQLRSSYKSNKITFLEIHDSVYFHNYEYCSAKVIRNSIGKEHNYFTIDKGRKHGIKPEMAVISPSGVAGIVKSVSNNYASVVSLLNNKLYISAKIKSSGYFGSIHWDGMDYRKVKLLEIPYHVQLHKGDTIVTSGYSAIFPEGVEIGTIIDFEREKGDNFYDIDVALISDFKQLSYVHVVRNLLKDELKQLENTTDND